MSQKPDTKARLKPEQAANNPEEQSARIKPEQLQMNAEFNYQKWLDSEPTQKEKMLVRHVVESRMIGMSRDQLRDVNRMEML